MLPVAVSVWCGVARRHRVVVAVEASQAQGADGHHLEAARLERLRGQRQEGGSISRQQCLDRLGASGQATLAVADAVVGQAGVQLLPAGSVRHRHEEVAADVADAVLDVAFLVGLPDAAEVSGEEEVALQPAKLSSHLALVRPGVLGDGDLGVVVADAVGHAAKESEGSDVALMEGLGALTRIGSSEASATVRQGEDEEGGLAALAGHDNGGRAVVALGLAGAVQQGHEDLGLGVAAGSDGVADDAHAACVAVLVAQTLKDASSGVALLGGSRAVVCEDLLDGVQEGPQDGLGSAFELLVGAGLGLVDNFDDGAEVEVILAAGLPEAQFFAQDTATNFGPQMHVCKHSCLPLSGS